MRKYYIDNIRWITVVLVVIYHVIYMYNGEASAGVAGPFKAVQYQDAIQNILYPWFMVLLFIISGMSSRYYLEDHSLREFMHSRTGKLLIPSTIGLFVFQWLQGYINMQLSGAFEKMGSGIPGIVLYLIMCVSGTGVLWYIQMLWIFSVLLVLIKKIENGKFAALCDRTGFHPLFIAAFGIAVWGAAQILNTPIIAVYRFGIYGLTFFMGYYVFSKEQVTDELSKYAPLFGTAALILAAISVKAYFGQNYAISPIVNSPLSVAYLWSACLFILGFMKRFGNKTCVFAGFMNKKSWGLYIFHYLPLSVCGLLLKGNADIPELCIYILTGSAAFAGAFALYEIISRIPVIRWCVLGIGGKKGGMGNVKG